MPRSPTGCARSSITSARPRTCGSTALCWPRRSGVHVPELVPELSTRRLLTMTWLDGRRCCASSPSMPTRRCATRSRCNMFRAWYVPFYHYGVIHGDPHLGNYTVRPDGTVNLLDFGCIRIFRPSFVEGRHRSLSRAAERRPRPRRACLRELGLQGSDREMIDVLNRWARFVYGAAARRPRRAASRRANAGVYGREVAEGVHRRPAPPRRR